MILDQNPIPSFVIRYRKLKAQADLLKSQMDEIKDELEPLVEASGGKWTDDVGYARIVERKESVSYDNKALNALYESVPDIAKALGPHRKSKPGYTYLQVK